MRTMEFGSPGPMRQRLNALVLSGRKVATFGQIAEYEAEGEAPEKVGERLAMVDDDGNWVGTIEITEARQVRVADVTWAMIEAEGEGDRSIAEWREGHNDYWSPLGYTMADDTLLHYNRFRLVDPLPPIERPTAGDLGLPEGYRHEYSGKVRDLFRTPGDDLLFVASDRVSAYDWVLSTPIPDKGAILTAISLWWFERLADIVPNHVRSIDVPESVVGRAMICQPLQMYPVECVVRGYLTGSGLTDYRGTGSVGGHALPAGLEDGSRLPEPLFAPATKAALGSHDENIDFAGVEAIAGHSSAAALRDTSLAIYRRAVGIAEERGIILADTKFEFGRPLAGEAQGAADPSAGLVLGDEVLTPDSSRFWPVESWQPGQPQPSFDKQFVRDWLTSRESGWDRAAGGPPPPLPIQIVEQTRDRYVEAYQRLTGRIWS